MPADAFSHSVVAAADPATIWEALQIAATWSHIGPVTEVWDATHGPDGTLTGYRWSADAAGRRWEGTARTIEVVTLHRMSLALDSPELQGTLTTVIDPGSEHTSDLTVTLQARATGMLATLFWGVVRQAIRAGLPHQVEEFAARLRDG